MCKYRQYIHKYSTINPQISLRNLYREGGEGKGQLVGDTEDIMATLFDVVAILESPCTQLCDDITEQTNL